MFDKLSDIAIIDGMKTTLTTREFFRRPARVAALIRSGRRITVTRSGETFFEVLPSPKKGKGLTIKDFEHIVFSDPKLPKDLSKRVDEILYGDA